MAEKYLTDNPSLTIDETIHNLNPDKVVVVTDTNVEKFVFPILIDSDIIRESPVIKIPVGEEGKNLETVIKIWDLLERSEATRRSVILNVGGGVVTDIGGFAAASFKRGIRTVNFPTTLLGAVDAATGGKTGFNFRGLKNEIGAFHMPEKVIISVNPFGTLPKDELLSGYAEMVKTALISDKAFYLKLSDFENIVNSPKELGEAVEKCVNIKDDIVASDPHEKGLRKILNFGHTAGHAFESFSHESGSPVSHGKAVAHGMLVALIISHKKFALDAAEVYHFKDFLMRYYPGSMMKCSDMELIMAKMKKDKKNNSFGIPAFTLLKAIGEPEINCCLTEKEISEALEVYMDFTH